MKKSLLWRGFTVVELLVVISIIAILSTLAVTNYNSARMTSRDARRREDLKNYSNALKQYRVSKGSYLLNNSAGDSPAGFGGYSYGKMSFAGATYEPVSIAVFLQKNGYIATAATDPQAKNPQSEMASADYVMIRCDVDKKQVTTSNSDYDFGIIAKMEREISEIDKENVKGGCGDKANTASIVYDYADSNVIEGVANDVFTANYLIQR